MNNHKKQPLIQYAFLFLLLLFLSTFLYPYFFPKEQLSIALNLTKIEHCELEITQGRKNQKILNFSCPYKNNLMQVNIDSSDLNNQNDVNKFIQVWKFGNNLKTSVWVDFRTSKPIIYKALIDNVEYLNSK
jgi:hypothetical protein